MCIRILTISKEKHVCTNTARFAERLSVPIQLISRRSQSYIVIWTPGGKAGLVHSLINIPLIKLSEGSCGEATSEQK